ncbi:cell division regulator GpsB [Massilibacterium senegalense]|uniref:cell division regulator GpsB n=1 Tax=Massilibacterium senegalense TaxID=1632858 RepID=UPI0007854F6A|nr:cell division regulator GpsB [Massilibacterium senegalense]
MIMDNVKLTVKDILEQDFKTSLRGYNPEEVDAFLDIVIKDYEEFQNEIDRLRKENTQLKRELDQKRAIPSQPTQGTTNYDILKRLSNLEKHVFGNKLSD